MRNKTHPYIPDAADILAVINKLRKNVPPTITSHTVEQFNIASSNASYVINALQFINVIDVDGKVSKENKNMLLLSKDGEFQDAFSNLVKEAYIKLFDLYGDSSWTLDESDLLAFFRSTDRTSEIIGGSQTEVFQMFSALSGKTEPPIERKRKNIDNTPRLKAKKFAKVTSPKQAEASTVKPATSIVDRLGMSIRVEVNLPSDASKETYDNIFKSIRENLIDE